MNIADLVGALGGGFRKDFNLSLELTYHLMERDKKEQVSKHRALFHGKMEEVNGPWWRGQAR